MVPYKKYVVLYQATKNGNNIAKIVYLGKNSENPKAIITKNTFGFRIISTQLELKDLAEGFFGSDEEKNSKMYYIGKEFELSTFLKQNPKYELPDYVKENPNIFSKVIVYTTFDRNVEDTTFVYKYGRYETICAAKVTSLCKIIDSKELVNYKEIAIL